MTAPPLPPPNWIRSRIRRLFLVSLGVPVDLDEILPTSKQSKLVLPSSPHAANDRDRSGGRSGDAAAPEGEAARGGGGGGGGGGSTPSSQRSSRPVPGQRASPPSDPDIAAGRRLCQTTEAAMSSLTDEELNRHVQQLEMLTTQAADALGYWRRRIDDAQGDKVAFEGVIENLVRHARRVRK